MRRLTRDERRKLTDMVQSGSTQKSIASEFGMSLDWASKKINGRAATPPDQYSRCNHRRAKSKLQTEEGFFNEHERENWLI